MPLFLMIHLPIMLFLILLTLCVSAGLMLNAKGHTGFVAGLASVLGWVVMLFSLLVLICAIYTGQKMWHQMPSAGPNTMQQLIHKEGISDMGSPGQPGN